MTSKEKAQQLVVKCMEIDIKYKTSHKNTKQRVKEYAILAVDEIINPKTEILVEGEYNGLLESDPYWEDVKREIEKL